MSFQLKVQILITEKVSIEAFVKIIFKRIFATFSLSLFYCMPFRNSNIVIKKENDDDVDEEEVRLTREI